MTATDPALLHRDPQYTYPVLVKGEGIYLYDETGNRYIDGTAGAGNVTLGHGRHAHRRGHGRPGTGVGVLLFDVLYQ